MKDILIYTARDGEKVICNMEHVTDICQYDKDRIAIYFDNKSSFYALGDMDDFINLFKSYAGAWVLTQKPVESGENQLGG